MTVGGIGTVIMIENKELLSPTNKAIGYFLAGQTIPLGLATGYGIANKDHPVRVGLGTYVGSSVGNIGAGTLAAYMALKAGKSNEEVLEAAALGSAIGALGGGIGTGEFLRRNF